ncbi:TPA: hypothetical protein N0F65_010048 [Lagenidium giganteum]|uniref:TNFR-Cys domain-containing protein n=1 Tax=Lagenidium giganteum TaxID=4803 RepID=A0AAV2ZHL7_9STRA|nr:TPA: hypothetical protein N0F65_010048 [Lagenidium giganteum]
MRSSHLVAFVLVLVVWLTGTSDAVAPGRFQFRQAVYTTSENLGVAYVTVQRGLGSDGRAAVYVSTLVGGGNAVLNTDFQPVFNRSLTWQDGDSDDKELYVKILNDGTPQDTPKTFSLFLHDPTGGVINAERNVTVVVLAPTTNVYPGSFRFLNSSLTANEDSVNTFNVPVVWENGSTLQANVSFDFVNETAGAPDVTILTPTPLNWTRNGPVIQYIQLLIISDGIFEQSETFRLRLKLLDPPVDAAGFIVGLGTGSIGAIGETRITIAGPNDVHGGTVQFQTDCFPACPSLKYSVYDSGFVRVTIQRRNGSDADASVQFSTQDDTAVAGVDYVPTTQTLSWTNGDTTERTVLVYTVSGVVRTQTTRFKLVLSAAQGATLALPHASTSYVDILGPSNVYPGEVNFAVEPLLNSVLRFPDMSFLPFVTRLDSGLHVCPRVVVTKPGPLRLQLHRSFANVLQTANVSLRSLDGTALGGVDFTALPATTVITWLDGDQAAKDIVVTILDPPMYYTEKRSFWLELYNLNNLVLGNCDRVEIVLDSVSLAPRLLSFDLNMNMGKLTFTLTNPVLAATFDASKVQLQSAASDATLATEVIRLTPQVSTTASPDSPIIVIDLGAQDLNRLKMALLVAKGAVSTFLALETGVFDYRLESCIGGTPASCVHTPFARLPSTSAQQVTTYTPDTTRPVLLSYTLDLTSRLLRLKFSEAVDRSNVNIESLGFSSTAVPITIWRLTPTSTVLFSPQPDPLSGALLADNNKLPPDGTYVTLLVGDADVQGLAGTGNGQIGIQSASTFLTIASTFIQDLAPIPNAVQPIEPPTQLLQSTTADCSACAAGTFLSSSCSDIKDRVCSPCTVCPTNSYALVPCTPLQDTLCYPCTECPGGQFASVQCTPTTDRVCKACTKCTMDEYESAPCYNGVDRICRTCDSCTLTRDQQRLCQQSFKWKRKQMKAPYGCPTADQQWQTLEARLQRQKSNRCGAGRCSCTGNGVGNANPSGQSFPDDPRCTGPDAYNIFI